MTAKTMRLLQEEFLKKKLNLLKMNLMSIFLEGRRLIVKALFTLMFLKLFLSYIDQETKYRICFGERPVKMRDFCKGDFLRNE